MSTIGYGDRAPISTNEKLFIIVISVAACAYFGYVVGSMNSIL